MKEVRDSEQLSQYLTGELPLDRLPDETRLVEVRLRELLATLEEDVQGSAEFRDGVMRRVAQVPASSWRRAVTWWLRPHTIRVRPAAGALAIAASAVLLLLWSGSGRQESGGEPAQAASQVLTRFVLVAPEASSVHVTGDFSSWSKQGIALEDLRGTGIWTADVMLPPGIYQYTFILNGNEWVADPRAVSQVDDGFGQTNSVVIVSGGEA